MDRPICPILLGVKRAFRFCIICVSVQLDALFYHHNSGQILYYSTTLCFFVIYTVAHCRCGTKVDEAQTGCCNAIRNAESGEGLRFGSDMVNQTERGGTVCEINEKKRPWKVWMQCLQRSRVDNCALFCI